MQPVEIKKDIFWVGCVDYDHRDFHGYSRSPDGSTYNAYLIKDQKNVLIDTVAPGCAGTLLCRLAKTLAPGKVDYIVCNHIELDHSGSLAEVVERVKPEKIFVSQAGLKSMAGYFAGKNWPVQAVKSGDILNIGSRNIVFQETRMLHWPDSMVSYIPEEKLLISNDIFGQNIASSARFADDFGDDGEFVKRIKEYFYNIILPYSPMVLKTLPVVEKLDIDMIAPDHGLIHRGEKAVRFIIDMYRMQRPGGKRRAHADHVREAQPPQRGDDRTGRLRSRAGRFADSQQHGAAFGGRAAHLYEGAAAAQPRGRRLRLLRLVGRSAQISPGTAGRHEYGHARRSREVQLGSGQGRIPRLP